MTDLEKGLEIKDTAVDNMAQATNDNLITPSGAPVQDAEYRPGMLSTAERRRISDELKAELRRNGGPSHQLSASEHSQEESKEAPIRTNTQQPTAISPDQFPVGPDPTPSVAGANRFPARGLTEEEAFENLKFVYRYNLLYWRARVFKYSLLKYKYSPWPDTCTAENINKDLERYSRAMDMYRAFTTRPGDLKDNIDVKNMGRMMLEYDEAKIDDSHEAGTKESRALAEQRLELQYYLLEDVMKIGRTGITAEIHADRWARFVRNLVMALVGGFALIVPMLIMTLHSTRLTNLLTTSVFVFAVALLLAGFMKEADAMQIVSVTAAYAAVLVVFVGTITTPSS